MWQQRERVREKSVTNVIARQRRWTKWTYERFACTLAPCDRSFWCVFATCLLLSASLFHCHRTCNKLTIIIYLPVSFLCILQAIYSMKINCAAQNTHATIDRSEEMNEEGITGREKQNKRPGNRIIRRRHNASGNLLMMIGCGWPSNRDIERSLLLIYLISVDCIVWTQRGRKFTEWRIQREPLGKERKKETFILGFFFFVRRQCGSG